MKNLLLLAVIIFLTSCGENKYEKAIADYVQTIGNTKIDIKFKAIEVKELKSITVADSIAYWERTIGPEVKDWEESIKKEQAKYEEDSIKGVPDALNELNIKMINYSKAEYNKVLSIENYWKDRYKDKDPNEVLRVLVECRFSAENPFFNNAKQETTNTYVMSPDGTVCYGKLDENE